MIEITLTPSEILLGATAGMMRRIFAIKNSIQNANGYDGENSWQIDIEGALGEMAVAKHMNRYWAGKGRMRDFDVANSCDVRTGAKHTHRLILHPNDDDDRVFWLATGSNGKYRIHGWIKAIDGKKPEYWGEKGQPGRPAFFVPQHALHDGMPPDE